MMRASFLPLILSIAMTYAAFVEVRKSQAADEPNTALPDQPETQDSENSDTESVETATRQAVEQQTVQRIVDEWTRRSCRYESVEFVVEMNTETSHRDPRRIELRRRQGAAAKSNEKTQDVVGDDPEEPPLRNDEVIRKEERWRLLINGPRSRMDRVISSPMSQTWITVNDGKESSELISYFQLDNGLLAPSASVHVSENKKLPVNFWPIFFSFPGLKNAGPSIDLRRLKLCDQGGVFDGEDCVITDCPAEGIGQKYRLWFAPHMGFSIVRCASFHGQQIVWQLDCRYQKNPTDFWIPDRWTFHWFDGAGKPVTTSELKVRSYNLNPYFTESDFELNFPVGTVVTDLRYDRKHGHSYVVAPDGNQQNAQFSTVMEANSGRWAKGTDGVPYQTLTPVVAESILAETRTMSKIELLGGKLMRSTTDAGRPVIGVRFGRDSRFRDKYLRLLKEFSDLTELSFSDPQITDACLQELKHFKKLTRLTLWEPELTEQRLRLLAELHNLTSVSIFGGRIAKDGLVVLNGLKQLRNLHIERTTLTEARLEDLRELTVLRELRLIKCGLMPQNLTGLIELKSLTTLDLTDSHVADEGMQHLGKIKHVKELIIANTGITDTALKELRNFQELTWLDIRRCGTTNAGLKELAALSHLTHLELAGQSITDTAIKAIHEFRNLKELSLYHTQITDACLEELSQLEGLTELNLSRTQLTDAGFKQLRAAMPKTRILGGELPEDGAGEKRR